MTESQLIAVLRTRFNVDMGRLNDIIGLPDFAEKLFEGPLDRRYAGDLLREIFYVTIPLDSEICGSARAIVRYVKTWPKKSDELLMACAWFYDHEVAAELRPRL